MPYFLHRPCLSHSWNAIKALAENIFGLNTKIIYIPQRPLLHKGERNV